MKKEFQMLIHFSSTWGVRKQPKMMFDYDVWCNIVDKCTHYKFDTIVLDLLDGLNYTGYPELWIEGGWSHDRLKDEVKRVKALGLKMIPKLNLSAAHDIWLGEFGRSKISTPEYYKMVKDIIEEVYEIFDAPEYIHVGLDEEFKLIANSENHYRTDEQLFHDWKYIFDCVRSTGAKIYMWESTCKNYHYYHHDDWQKVIDEDIVFGAGQYYEFEKSKWTPIENQPQEVQKYYWGGLFEQRDQYAEYVERYGNTKIEYVEQDPDVRIFMEFLEYLVERKHKIFINTTNCFIKTNDRSAVEYYSKCDYNDAILGHIGCPWVITTKQNEAAILEEIENLGKARIEFYE